MATDFLSCEVLLTDSCLIFENYYYIILFLLLQNWLYLSMQDVVLNVKTTGFDTKILAISSATHRQCSTMKRNITANNVVLI